MANMRNQYMTAAGTDARAAADGIDWSQEISGAQPRAMGQTPAAAPAPMTVRQPPAAAELANGWLNCSNGNGVPGAQLDLRHGLSQDVVQAPTTVDEAQMGSMKAVLGKNLGNFVVATLLIGTQGTTSWEGVLYDVGNDYLVIYQTGRDRYIICDIYSLKYIEFYDNRRREMCENILRQNGWQDRN